MDPAVERFLKDHTPEVRHVFAHLHERLVDRGGCTAYVKTIYVGFELSEEMVAAAYPHPTHVEVALALPDEISGADLIDATHLTWRSMPVAVEIGSRDEFARISPYLDQAVERVRTGAHNVDLPQERFMARGRRIADPTILGRRGRK